MAIDPLTAGLLIQAGSGVLGEILSAGDSAEQQRLIREAMAQFSGLTPPELEEMGAVQLGPSAMSGVRADPEAIAAQKAALEALQGVAQSGGMRLEDRAMQNQALQRAAQQEAAGRAAISQNMAMRNVGGSGAELAMQLQNQQGSANRGAMASQQAAADAQRRAFDAMLARGRLGGDIRGQDFSEKSRAAEAQDAVSRWNAAARQDANRYNAGLQQQNFNSRLAIAQGKAGALTGGANAAGQRAADTRGVTAGVGKAAYETAYAYDDPRRKKQGGSYP